MLGVICIGWPHTTTYDICKFCLLMHLVRNSRKKSYLANNVTITANLSVRTRLQSASSFRYTNIQERG